MSDQHKTTIALRDAPDAGDTSREAVERLIDRLLRASRRTRNAGKSAAAHGDTGAAWFCEREAADLGAAVFALRDLLDAREANCAVAQRMKRERDEAREALTRIAKGVASGPRCHAIARAGLGEAV